MFAFPLLAVSLVMNIVAVMFGLTCIVLILIILVQKGRGGGLSAAFGGAGASSILGSKTGDFLTWVTIILVGLFLLLAVVMGKFYRPSVSDYGAGAGQAPPPVTTTEEVAPAVTDGNSAGAAEGSGG